MEMERYDLVQRSNGSIYEFYSEGPKCRIKKTIKFQQIEEGFFNVFFGDFIEATGKINDLVLSNNGDRNKILFTVAAAVHHFMGLNPDAVLLAVGSTDARTRLYQMNISRFRLVIRSQYRIYGKLGEDWLPFRRGINYEGFLLVKKMG